MKQKVETHKRPQQGDTRIIKKFLFWPKTLTKFKPHNGQPHYYSYEERRWLKNAKIEQIWVRCFIRKGKNTYHDVPVYRWVDCCWANEDE